jgi:hypothetical protein
MISTSSAYKTQIKESGHFPEFAAELHFADSTVLELISADFMATPAPQISFGTSRPGVFDVGIATMKTFECLLNNFSGKFDGYDFSGAVFYPKEGLTLTDTTVEYLTLGKFTVDECERLTKTIRIVAVDDMYKLEKPYADGHHVCPATVEEMLEDICTQCSVTWDASPLLVYGNLILGDATNDDFIIDGTCDAGAQEIGGAAFDEDFGTFTNADMTVAVKPYGEGLTYRDVLSWICTLACCNAWFTPTGVLHLGWYAEHETLTYHASIPLLRSAGTVADTVATDGTYTVNIGKKVFDGSETWTEYAPASTLTNLVTNGDFSNGTTGWTAAHGTAVASDNTYIITGNGTQAYSYVTQLISAPTVGRKYAITLRVRVTNSDCTTIKWRFGLSTYSTSEIIAPTINEWYQKTYVFTADSTYDTIMLVDRYTDAAAANGKVMEVQYVSCVDLTAAFGAGNEPTQTEFESWINTQSNSWFDTTAQYLCNTNQWF